MISFLSPSFPARQHELRVYCVYTTYSSVAVICGGVAVLCSCVVLVLCSCVVAVLCNCVVAVMCSGIV